MNKIILSISISLCAVASVMFTSTILKNQATEVPSQLGALQTTGENSFWGVKTQASSSVGIYATSSVLSSNSTRQYARLTNTGLGNIFLGLGSTAVASTGVVIYPGTAYEINPLNLYKGAIEAIALTATSTLLIVEK